MRTRTAGLTRWRLPGADRRLRAEAGGPVAVASDGWPSGRERDPARACFRRECGKARTRNGAKPSAARREANTERRLRAGSRGAEAAMSDNKPLAGSRILTTRASKQSGGLAKPL